MDFEDIVKIARGGFSSVYQARHKLDQQLYAVKKTVLRVNSLKNPGVIKELERMIKEARIFASVQDPHIIRYHNCWLEKTEIKNKQEKPKDKVESPTQKNASPEVSLETSCIEFARSEEKSQVSSVSSISMHESETDIAPSNE